MAQTLLSVAALFAFSLLGFAMHKHVAQVEKEAYVAELESAALDLAQAWTSRIKNYVYDEADLDATGVRGVGDTFGLTAVADLGPEAGEDSLAAFDDIDDFHRTTLRVAAPVARGVHAFDVSFAVRYVTDLDFSVASAGTSTAKEVAVQVREADPVQGRLPVTVTLAIPLTPVKLFIHQ